MTQELFARLQARLADPQRIHDMARNQVKPVPQVNPVATADQMDKAEAQLGFALPVLFKQLYTKIGNGGFGPGYGLYPIEEIATGYLRLRQHNPHHPTGYWPTNLVEICTWGCGIGSCIDYMQPGNPVFIYDPEYHVLDGDNISATMTDAQGVVVWEYRPAPQTTRAAPRSFKVMRQRSSFAAWLLAWAEGVDLWGEFYG